MDLERRRSDNGSNPIRSVFCCGDCSHSGTSTSNFEHSQIYLGDHLTRSWNRPVKVPPTAASKKQNNTQGSLKDTEQNTSSYKVSSVRRASRRRKIKNAKELLSTYNVSRDDIEVWSSSFDALLKSDAGINVFWNFLESEFAEENLKFWLACEDLNTSGRSSKKLEKRIKDIYDTYIDTRSTSEVNIDYKMRESIVQGLTKSDAGIFKEAQHQIYSLMYRDSYPRFLSSNFVTELIDEVNEYEQNGNEGSGSTRPGSDRDRRKLMCCGCVRRQESSTRRAPVTPASHAVVEEHPRDSRASDATNEATPRGSQLAVPKTTAVTQRCCAISKDERDSGKASTSKDNPSSSSSSSSSYSQNVLTTPNGHLKGKR